MTSHGKVVVVVGLTALDLTSLTYLLTFKWRPRPSTRRPRALAVPAR